jgi:uncharacterized protein (TIGR02246 family)
MISSNTTSVQDDSALRSVLDGVYRALANNDADAFVASYADEATATFAGRRQPNREAIRTSMANGFAGPLMGSRGIIEIDSIRFISADAAIALSRSALLFPGETEAPTDRWVWETWTLSSQNGRWLVQAYHSCPVHTG